MAKTIESVSIGIKLDGTNFPVWSRLMRIAIGSREKLDHLEGEKAPPQTDDPKFQQWQAADFTVFSWLIQNMEPRLVLQFAQHQTAKAMWRSLTTTFGVRADPVQVYDLEDRTNKLRQGNDSLEAYWSELQNLWVGMDNRKPCPYTCCEKAVNTYRKEVETKRLYQFLSGLNERHDGLRRELLKENPEPSAEDAFRRVKQEETRIGIWKPTAQTLDSGIGGGFGARQPPPQYQSRGTQPPHQGSPALPPRGNSNNRRGFDKSKLYCTHYGMTKHTKETCFKLVGFPEWWEDGHKANRNNTGKGKLAVWREENEGNNGNAVPAGNQVATRAGNDSSRLADDLIAGCWWGNAEEARREKRRLGLRILDQ